MTPIKKNLAIAFFVLAIIVPLILVYAKLTAPGIAVTRTFFPPNYAGALIPSPLAVAKVGEQSELTVEFPIPDAQLLPTAIHVGIRLGTYDTSPDIVVAKLSIGPTCSFQSSAIRSFADNSALELTKSADCLVLPAAKTAKLTVTTTETSPQLAAWGYKNKAGLWAPVYFLEFPSKLPAETKFSLLKRTWGGAADLLIIVLVGGGILYFLAGVFIAYAAIGKKGNLAGLGWGFALQFLSLTIVYACLVPPFQAPDEPDHFLGIGVQQGLTAFSGEALELAALGHFSRIRQETEERFTVEDGQNPGLKSWGNRRNTRVSASSMISRAPFSAQFWSILSPLFFDATTPVAIRLMAMRLLSACFVFAGLILFNIGVARRFSDGLSYVLALAPTLLLLPLPFFAMHISNYSQMLALTLATAGIILLPVTSLMGATVRMATIGILSVCFLDSGKPAILAFGILVYLSAKSLQSDRLKFANTTLLSLVQPGLAYAGAFSAMASFLGFLPVLPDNPIRPMLDQLGISFGGFGFSLFTLAFSALSLSLANLFCDGVRLVGKVLDKSGRSASLGKYARVGFLLAVGFALFLSAYRNGLTLWNIEMPELEVSAVAYIKRALLIAVLTPSPWIDDFFIVKSLWFGFGWLDIPAPPLLLLLVKLLAGLCCLKYIWSAASNKSAPSFWLSLAADALVCLASLSLYAFAAYRMHINLHGRYLLSLFILCASLPCLMAFKSGSRGSIFERIAPGLAFGVVGGFQVAALITVISRYFG